jgi:hypothetical protein
MRRHLAPLVALSLVVVTGASAKKAFTAPDEAQVSEATKAATTGATMNERLVTASQPFLGAPYGVSPLGEGEGAAEDADPRIRYDVFDCTTFVETTFALAFAKDLDEARALLDAIRYRDGEVGFLKRRHFPQAEWIPELAELGFLRDITREVGADDVTDESKLINPAVWDRRKRPSHLELPEERIPNGNFTLPVWDLDAARAGQTRIPPGTLLNLVRVDFKSVPVRVSHQGLVIEKKGKRYLRHAADRMFHSVVDEPLDHFFLRMQKYKKWPVKGVNLQEVREPADWRARLSLKGAPKKSPPRTTAYAH